MELDLTLSSGRVRARSWGPADGPLVLCAHGVSANLTAFSLLAEALAADGRRVVAFDCRGRGRSEVTDEGTYGMESHARDAAEIATQLGAERYAFVGWSMGALIGLRLAGLDGGRISHLVLLDLAGRTDGRVTGLVEASVARLDAKVPSPDVYVEAIRSAGVIAPWTDFWTDHYSYELVPTDDGQWSASTDRHACLEDLADTERGDWRATWAALDMPVLLVQATRPIADCTFVPADVLDDLRAAVPRLQVVETAANHYTLVTDPAVFAAVRDALAVADGEAGLIR
jgi:pimeloyl-ACP methyl ester carboxylesterase